MEFIKLYIGILVAFVVGAILIGVILYNTFKKTKKIDLVQGKLRNSDSYISDVVPFLKITNEWSSADNAD